MPRMSLLLYVISQQEMVYVVKYVDVLSSQLTSARDGTGLLCLTHEHILACMQIFLLIYCQDNLCFLC